MSPPCVGFIYLSSRVGKCVSSFVGAINNLVRFQMLAQYTCTVYIGTTVNKCVEFWAKDESQAKSIAEEHKRLAQDENGFVNVVLVRKLDKKTIWM